jgi:hypothetical protein
LSCSDWNSGMIDPGLAAGIDCFSASNKLHNVSVLHPEQRYVRYRDIIRPTMPTARGRP